MNAKNLNDDRDETLAMCGNQPCNNPDCCIVYQVLRELDAPLDVDDIQGICAWYDAGG